MDKSLKISLHTDPAYEHLPLADPTELASRLGYSWIRVASYMQCRRVVPYNRLQGPYVATEPIHYPPIPANGRALSEAQLGRLNHGDMLLFGAESIGCYIYQPGQAGPAVGRSLVGDIYWLASASSIKPAYVKDSQPLKELLAQVAIRQLPGPNNWSVGGYDLQSASVSSVDQLAADILKIRL